MYFFDKLSGASGKLPDAPLFFIVRLLRRQDCARRTADVFLFLPVSILQNKQTQSRRSGSVIIQCKNAISLLLTKLNLPVLFFKFLNRFPDHNQNLTICTASFIVGDNM